MVQRFSAQERRIAIDARACRQRFTGLKPWNYFASGRAHGERTRFIAAHGLRAIHRRFPSARSAIPARWLRRQTLGLTVSDPPVQGEAQAIADKLDELTPPSGDRLAGGYSAVFSTTSLN